jgi:Tat protein secretion system quality control protein TatD with DNase activity
MNTLAQRVIVAAAVALLTVPVVDAQVPRRMRRQAAGVGELTGDAIPFVDAHVHLNDARAWITLMDEAGIPRSIVFAGRNVSNAGLLTAARSWPDRLVPFLSISPEHREFRGAWEADDPAVVSIADSLLEAGGFYGIGEISVVHFSGVGFPEADFDPMGRVMRGLLAVAGKHRVPISVHVEVTRLREFEALLAEFRDVTVIWAHGGYVPLFLARHLLEQHPNLIFELSARTWVRHPRSPDYTILQNGADVWPEWLSLIEEMPDRFVVGTDASLRSNASDLGKISSVRNLLGQLAPAIRWRVGI